MGDILNNGGPSGGPRVDLVDLVVDPGWIWWWTKGGPRVDLVVDQGWTQGGSGGGPRVDPGGDLMDLLVDPGWIWWIYP